MIVKCTHCNTNVEVNDAHMEHPSYMDPGTYQVKCDACTRWFNFTVQDETVLKTLTSSTPWMNEWANYRAVDSDGDLFEYENKPYIGNATNQWEVEEGLSYREGRDYDASDWKNTLQERDGSTIWYEEAAEIPKEVWDKLLMPKAVIAYADPVDLTDEYWEKEKDGVYIPKENKVEETKTEPATTGLKNILEALPKLSNKELDHLMIRCVNQFVFRATDRGDYVALMAKYDSLQKNFDILLTEKSQLQTELKDIKKHMKKIMEAVAYGDSQQQAVSSMP